MPLPLCTALLDGSKNSGGNNKIIKHLKNNLYSSPIYGVLKSKSDIKQIYDDPDRNVLHDIKNSGIPPQWRLHFSLIQNKKKPYDILLIEFP